VQFAKDFFPDTPLLATNGKRKDTKQPFPLCDDTMYPFFQQRNDELVELLVCISATTTDKSESR
jgi:hypothetical protein